jgi:hypothetical protein
MHSLSNASSISRENPRSLYNCLYDHPEVPDLSIYQYPKFRTSTQDRGTVYKLRPSPLDPISLEHDLNTPQCSGHPNTVLIIEGLK